MNLKVNPAYVKRLEEFGMKFVGHDVDGERMEIMELEGKILSGIHLLNSYLTAVNYVRF